MLQFNKNQLNTNFKVTLLLTLLLAGCGKPIKFEVQTKPVDVNHKVQLDITKIEAYFREDCKTKFVAQVDIDNCTNKAVTDFIKTYSN